MKNKQEIKGINDLNKNIFKEIDIPIPVNPIML